MLLVDTETARILDANPAAADYYGYPLLQLKQMKVSEINMLSPAEILDKIEQAVSRRENAVLFSHRLASGEIRQVEVHSTPIHVEKTEQLLSIIHDVTERVRLEAKLKTQEENLQSILQGTRAGTWEWNVQSGETVFNERWAEIVGYTLDELQPVSIATWMRLTHPEDLEKSDKLLQEHFQGKLPYYSFDSRMKHKNGTWVWVYDCGRVTTWDEKGNPVKMFGTHIDITERRQAEVAQERNALIQSVLREIADTANTALSLEDLYAAVNRLTNQVLPSDIFHLALLDDNNTQIVDGYSRDTKNYVAKRRPIAKGLTEYTLKHGRTLHVTASELQRLQESGEVIRQSSAPIHEWLGAPLFTSSGKGIGVLAVISRNPAQSFQPGDVEVLAIIAAQVSMAIERKQSEDAIRASQARYQAFMEQSYEAQAVIDIQTQEIVEINRRVTELFGYSLPEDSPLYAKQVAMEPLENMYSRYVTIKEQRFLPVATMTFRHKNGTAVLVERAGTVVTIDGRDYLLVSMRDMTMQRRREAELARDVGLASRVQRELLPALPVSPLITLRNLYYPAHDVSGDSYQMEWKNEGMLLRGFLIDVSGHGLGTALQTSSISVLLRENSRTSTSLLEEVQRVNAQAAKYFAEGSYATLLGFDLDLSRRELRYVGAGISKFFINGREILTPGMFIGMWEDAEFEAGRIPVAAGDCLYFLTDGFTDLLAQPENNNFWSMDGKDFEADVAALERLAESGMLRDDATGVCFKIMT